MTAHKPKRPECERLYHRIWNEPFHRFTLRVPKSLMAELGRIKGKLSYNDFFIEAVRYLLSRKTKPRP